MIYSFENTIKDNVCNVLPQQLHRFLKDMLSLYLMPATRLKHVWTVAAKDWVGKLENSRGRQFNW